MTQAERHAVLQVLRTADFSKSPGLRNRLRRSLAPPRDWGITAALAAGIAIWALLIWSML